LQLFSITVTWKFRGDVTSLYTNIDLNRTIAVVKQFFKKYLDGNRADLHILDLLNICFEICNFYFGTNCFLQTKSIAMGKKICPSFSKPLFNPL
jgi:hypothetical protein